MALLKSVSQICVLLTALCGVVFSQGAADPNLFSSILSSTPQTGANTMGGGAGPADLSALLNNPVGGNPSFAPTSLPNSMPPSPSFPTMGSPYNSSPLGTMNFGAPAPQPQPLPQPNPLQTMLRFSMFRKMDMNPMMTMLLMRGMGGMGGAGGGLFSNPLMMMSLLNN